MTGGHDASNEASDDAFTEEPDRGTNAWSLLYADAPLKPTSCPDCGNVFATDSTSCPWCGRIVTASERGALVEAVGDASTPVMPAAVAADVAHDPLEYPSPSSTEAAAAYRARQARSAENAAGLRRWASLLLAAAVLLVIATGLTIRARNSRTSSAATTVATTARSTVATTAKNSSSSAAPSSPSTAANTATSDATVPTTAPTTAPEPTTVAPTGSSTTVTTVAPRFTAEQQQALELAQSLSTALATKDWSRVREITANKTLTDAQFEAGYGTLTRVDVVPAKIDKLTESTYDVFAGVVQVKDANGSITSTLYCNKYSVDLLAKTVTRIRATEPLRSATGAVSVTSVTDELASTCMSPNLTA